MQSTREGSIGCGKWWRQCSLAVWNVMAYAHISHISFLVLGIYVLAIQSNTYLHAWCVWIVFQLYEGARVFVPLLMQPSFWFDALSIKWTNSHLLGCHFILWSLPLGRLQAFNYENKRCTYKLLRFQRDEFLAHL